MELRCRCGGDESGSSCSLNRGKGIDGYKTWVSAGVCKVVSSEPKQDRITGDFEVCARNDTVDLRPKTADEEDWDEIQDLRPEVER